jgi:hypothetical protein
MQNAMPTPDNQSPQTPPNLAVSLASECSRFRPIRERQVPRDLVLRTEQARLEAEWRRLLREIDVLPFGASHEQALWDLVALTREDLTAVRRCLAEEATGGAIAHIEPLPNARISEPLAQTPQQQNQ